jgi:hypothetical protein
VLRAEDERAVIVEREGADAGARGEDEDAGRPIDDVAGGDLLGTDAEGCGGDVVAFRGREADDAKMVPTLTLTSMFEEPSRGSKMTTNCAPGCEKRTGASSSSLTTAATAGSAPRRSMRTSLAKTSSFCCCSPCTFTAP